MAEWYSEGLRFECTRCGNCCTGPPGVVLFDASEARAMAADLGIDEKTFRNSYAHRVDGRWSLRERETSHGFDCVLLDRTTEPGKTLCGVYRNRPAQCRTWPFWRENLRSEAAWARTRVNTPCPGMECGTLVPIEQIRILRDETT